MSEIIKPRYFNSIRILDDDIVEKSSGDIFKMKAEYEWYKNTLDTHHFSVAEWKCGIWTPSVYDYWETENRAGYYMDYIHGYTLSYSFVNGNADVHLFEKIFMTVDAMLRNLPEVEHITDYTLMKLHSMYEDKTLERLAQTNIDLDKEYVVNNHCTPTIREIIKNCPVHLNKRDIRYIHGDMCFSNMILTRYSKALPSYDWVFLIDPRGYIPGNTITQIGDINYDVAKLAHSVIGRYDQIQSRGFEIVRLSDNEYTWSIRCTDEMSWIEKRFKEIFRKYDYFNIMIHLFLSMIPLHKDDPEKQEKMLVNALRLYLEKENKFS